MPQALLNHPNLAFLPSKALHATSDCRSGHHNVLLSEIPSCRLRRCWQNEHRKSRQMNTKSLLTHEYTNGGRTTLNVAALKGDSLSTVLLAHPSHAEASELYKILISVQVHTFSASASMFPAF